MHIKCTLWFESSLLSHTRHVSLRFEPVDHDRRSHRACRSFRKSIRSNAEESLANA
jgi:hypothetical protein